MAAVIGREFELWRSLAAVIDDLSEDQDLEVLDVLEEALAARVIEELA